MTQLGQRLRGISEKALASGVNTLSVEQIRKVVLEARGEGFEEEEPGMSSGDLDELIRKAEALPPDAYPATTRALLEQRVGDTAIRRRLIEALKQTRDERDRLRKEVEALKAKADALDWLEERLKANPEWQLVYLQVFHQTLTIGACGDIAEPGEDEVLASTLLEAITQARADESRRSAPTP